MTQENKELLLRDLSARLPYGVMITDSKKEKLLDYLIIIDLAVEKGYKPYLRPMSSMTEEEKEKYDRICNLLFGYPEIGIPMSPISNVGLSWNTVAHLTDWLHKHHFDYRGLIEKGLALEAPEGMYGKEEGK